MSIPQWIIAGMLGLQIFGAFIMDGKPRKNPNYDGNLLFCGAIAEIALLGWGGFFGKF